MRVGEEVLGVNTGRTVDSEQFAARTNRELLDVGLGLVSVYHNSVYFFMHYCTRRLIEYP